MQACESGMVPLSSAKTFTRSPEEVETADVSCWRDSASRWGGAAPELQKYWQAQQTRATFAFPGEPQHMAYTEIFWMACDSTEQLRAEYGPFHTRPEAEIQARKLGFGYLLRYEHLLGVDEEIEEVRCIFVELPGADPIGTENIPVSLHTRCATCGQSSTHDKAWQAEVWADIHEFEHSRHRVRLFEHARGRGLKEICDWRA
jgi:hypothetical protein